MTKYIVILATIFLLISIGSPSKDDGCYFEHADGVLNKSLVASVIAKESLAYARFEGAETAGVFVSQKDTDSTTTVKVKSILRAKNAFGVYSTSTFMIEATLNCQGYSLISIKND